MERFKKVGEMAKLLRAVQLELQDRAKSKRFTRLDLQLLEARLLAIRAKGTELQTLDDQLQAAWWRQCSELFGNMGHQALFALAETQKQTGEQIRARLQDINSFKEERERMAGALSALKKQAEVEEGRCPPKHSGFALSPGLTGSLFRRKWRQPFSLSSRRRERR